MEITVLLLIFAILLLLMILGLVFSVFVMLIRGRGQRPFGGEYIDYPGSGGGDVPPYARPPDEAGGTSDIEPPRPWPEPKGGSNP